jgi:shikimate kinase
VNLVLIGMRGSGKSAVGRLLAQRLGRPFVDTDARIEQQADMTIDRIFTHLGEPAFRNVESRVIRQAAADDEQVIAVGGGALQRADNVKALRQTGWLAWLRAEPEELHRRLAGDPQSPTLRPALTDLSPLEELRALLQARQSAYEASADSIVDTDGRSCAEVAEAIVVAWSGAGR